jgi:uncharacterized membrane protein YhaH (DUF805 family)
MGTIGALFIVAIFFVIFGIPVVMIIRKAGYSGWWVLVYFVPFVNIIMLWVFAFSEWPNLARRPG